MRTRALTTLIGASAMALFIVSCGGLEPDDETSVQTIQESLELEDSGGLTMDDELPQFGLDAAELDEVDIEPTLLVPDAPAELDTLAGELAADPSSKPQPPPCPHGLLKGVWKHVKNGYGVFRGRWADSQGKVAGHLRGIYGRNKKGEGVLFGKYISKSGKFVGLLKGRYDNGFFKARWFDKTGLKGMMRGAYGRAKCAAATSTSGTSTSTSASGSSTSTATKCLPGDGIFVGKWVAFCPLCKVLCAPGYVASPVTKCLCVPAKVVPCVMGQCPKGMFCDLCPPLPGCKPGAPCAAVCAPPVCKAQPSTSTSPGAGTNSAASS